MQIVANETYIARRQFIGQYAGIAGLLILLAALVVPWIQPESLFATPLGMVVAIVLGMLFSFVGGFYSERFYGPRSHLQGVRDALKGLDNQYTLFQYVLPVAHVLLGPGGLTLFAVRSQPGEITYANGKWHHRQRLKFLRQLAGQENLGLPEADVQHDIRRLTNYLKKRLPEVEVPVQGAVLFTRPDTKVTLENPPLPMFFDKKVRSWLRGTSAAKSLSHDARRRLEELLAGPAQKGRKE